jgi:4a-hydroxytetrahydrobiopterin dehydratase
VAPSRSWTARNGVCLGGSADDVTSEWYAGTMNLLTEPQIDEELATVPAWARAGDSITTVTERSDFRDALLYLGAVAYLAESASHHPDVTIQWNKVTLTLSTHSAGGLTAADFALARQISALSPSFSPNLHKKTPPSLF